MNFFPGIHVGIETAHQQIDAIDAQDKCLQSQDSAPWDSLRTSRYQAGGVRNHEQRRQQHWQVCR